MQWLILFLFLLYIFIAIKYICKQTYKKAWRMIILNESKPYKVYRTERAMLVILPAQLARQLDIKIGDYVTWSLDRDQLIVRKARKII